jgi:hypothetical protein
MNVMRKSELGQQLLGAAERGELSVVESLIAQGADVNHTDTRAGVSVSFLWCDYYSSILLCVFLLL